MKKKNQKEPQVTTRIIDVLKDKDPETYKAVIERRKASVAKNKEYSKAVKYKQPTIKNNIKGKANTRSKG